MSSQAVAQLNAIVGTSPKHNTKKRSRKTDDLVVSPSKRLAIAGNLDNARPTAKPVPQQRTTRTSISKLPERDRQDSGVRSRRRGDVYAIDYSPGKPAGVQYNAPAEAEDGEPEPLSFSRAQKKGTRLKIVSKKKQKGRDRFSAAERFEVPGGVTLHAPDSPEKSRKGQKIKTVNPLNVLSNRAAAADAQEAPVIRQSPRKKKAAEHTETNGVEQAGTAVSPDKVQMQRKRDQTQPDDPIQQEHGDDLQETQNVARAVKKAGKSRSSASGQVTGQSSTLVDQEDPYVSADEEEQEVFVPPLAKETTGRQELGLQRGRSVPSQNGSAVNEAEDSEDNDEEDDGDEQAERARRQKAVRDAEEHMENIRAYEDAEREATTTYKTKYGEKLRGLVGSFGGLELWSTMGAAALHIENREGTSDDLESPRAAAAKRTLIDVGRQYVQLGRTQSFDEHKEDMDKLLSKLYRRCAKQYLYDPDLTDRQRNKTVTEIYRFLIPLAVRLLRKAVIALKAQLTEYDGACELERLAGSIQALCGVAREWQPRPTNLESGVLLMTKNRISSPLSTIVNSIKAYLDRKRYEEDLIKKRREDEEQRARLRAKLQDKDDRIYRRGKYARPSQIPKPAPVAVQPIVPGVSDLDGEDELPELEALFGKPGLERKQTEEIPPEDPTAVWTQPEDKALIDGLQEYCGADRYQRIWIEYEPLLEEKTVDQIIERARYHRQTTALRLPVWIERDGIEKWAWLSEIEIKS